MPARHCSSANVAMPALAHFSSIGWPPIGRQQFEREAGPDGALFVTGPTLSTRDVVYRIDADGIVDEYTPVVERIAETLDSP